MSDLQCPVRLFLVAAEGHRFDVLVGALRQERLARVYSGADASARHTASRVADELAVPAVVLTGLPEAGEIADDSPTLLLLLGGLADEHRGEAILMVGADPVLAAVASRVTRNGSPRPTTGAPLPPDAVVAVEGDADGWRLTRPWPS